VIASDIVKPRSDLTPFSYGNVLDEKQLDQLVVENDISWVVHNSSMLSAVAEKI
jgi:UDP-glucose 4-epimerase